MCGRRPDVFDAQNIANTMNMLRRTIRRVWESGSPTRSRSPKPPDSLAKEAEKKRRVFRQTHPAYELAATIFGCIHTAASDG